MEKEQRKATPLQAVEDCCRRLRREWESMMHDADVASTQALSSLKAQESVLMEERNYVQSLKMETNTLRRSLLQQTQEQAKKTAAEKSLADQIRQNIHNQLAEVKQMQCQLTSQLAQIRTSMENLRKPKEEDLANSSVMPSAKSESLGLAVVLPLEAEDSPNLGGLKDVSNIQSEKPGFETDIRIARDWETKYGAATPSQACKESYGKIKEQSIQVNEFVESRVNSPSSLQRSCDKGSLVCRNAHIGSITVKRESEEAPDNALLLLPCTEGAPDVNLHLLVEVDELDNVLLSTRLEFLLQRIRGGHFTREDSLSIPKCIPKLDDIAFMEKKKFSGLEKHSPRKRKWDVPIEVALQEDAPGLLEKLVERGLVEDMVIYGAFCEDEWENGEDHFKDLENIARKIWGTPSGLIKLPHAFGQHTSGVYKDSTYCLACLASLIDQAKVLKQRNWPVEWGWCRELQAFVFVFDMHNRIVLERPAYGNATYFFELVQDLPLKWQVLRLIRILSVTALGKTALLDNRPLQVGYELTEDESKILEYYGWVPGTGLGSFLNFCDRVFHDGQDDENLEWRQKIGKCLMDGYDRGRIVTSSLPLRFLEAANSVVYEEDIKPSTMLST